MTNDLTIILQDHPSALADVVETLGKAGINVDALCGFPCEGKGVTHIVVDDGKGAQAAPALPWNTITVPCALAGSA